MQSAFQDKTLPCRDCGNDFVWSAGEQEFYAAKDLRNVPGRCPACRSAARAARQSSLHSGRPRELFPAVCARCGVQTQVPFMPRDDRPVYCSTCYDTVRASASPA